MHRAIHMVSGVVLFAAGCKAAPPSKVELLNYDKR